MSLSNKALLIYVSVSRWYGKRTDKKAQRSAELAHGAKHGTVDARKKLLPGARELERLHAACDEMGRFVRARTLPWLADGTRIISSRHYVTFAKEFKVKEAELKAYVDAFLAQYETLREDARITLGDLFNESDYPSLEVMAQRWGCTVSVLPIPEAGDFRVEVSEVEKARLQAQYEAMEREVEARAMGDVWKRLHDVISKATYRLKEADPVFRNTLISNITDMLELLPALNVTDDPALEKARVDIEQAIMGVDAKTLRNDAKEREDVLRKLESIQDAMGAFMGASTSGSEVI